MPRASPLKPSSPALSFALSYASSHPTATYSEAAEAAAEAGHRLSPVVWGQARKSLRKAIGAEGRRGAAAESEPGRESSESGSEQGDDTDASQAADSGAALRNAPSSGSGPKRVPRTRAAVEAQRAEAARARRAGEAASTDELERADEVSEDADLETSRRVPDGRTDDDDGTELRDEDDGEPAARMERSAPVVDDRDQARAEHEFADTAAPSSDPIPTATRRARAIVAVAVPIEDPDEDALKLWARLVDLVDAGGRIRVEYSDREWRIVGNAESDAPEATPF